MTHLLGECDEFCCWSNMELMCVEDLIVEEEQDEQFDDDTNIGL